MGYILSKLLWPSEPEGYDVENENTGLTPREADIIQNTWGIVRKDLKGNGVALFLRYFELRPQYQKMFKAFADVPHDQLKNNGRLLGHATSVMYAFSSIVDNVNDVECLVQLLHKIADSHVPRKVEAKHFEDLALAIQQLLEEKLGPKIMDGAAKEAWRKVLAKVNYIILTEMDKAKER